MKAAQLLLLLIAFIAASHLRREAILLKHRGAHTQQNEEQAMAENARTSKDNSFAGYTETPIGMKKTSHKISFNYEKREQ